MSILTDVGPPGAQTHLTPPAPEASENWGVRGGRPLCLGAKLAHTDLAPEEARNPKSGPLRKCRSLLDGLPVFPESSSFENLKVMQFLDMSLDTTGHVVSVV